MPTDYQWKKINDERQKAIEDRISIKDQTIAYFNSLNSAIALIKDNYKNLDKDDMKEMIKEWRDWCFEEWRAFYISIMPVLEKTTPTWAKNQPQKVVKSELANEKGEEIKEEEKTKEEIEKINASLAGEELK